MGQSSIASDMFIMGALSAKQTILSGGCVADANVAANAAIEATKIIQQYEKQVDQKAGAAVVSQTDLLHIVQASGTGVATVAGFEAAVITPPTSTDTVTVDLQRSTGGGAFASILTSVITFNSSSSARTAVSASIASPLLNGGDLLQVVVTVTGTSCQGLLAQSVIRENPQ